MIVLDGDDQLTVRDPDGGQVAEVTALAPDGSDDAAALGARADAPAIGPALADRLGGGRRRRRDRRARRAAA